MSASPMVNMPTVSLQALYFKPVPGVALPTQLMMNMNSGRVTTAAIPSSTKDPSQHIAEIHEMYGYIARAIGTRSCNTDVGAKGHVH